MCAKKGTLSIVDSRTGKAKIGSLYNTEGMMENREYNVENILNHLEYLTKSYYSTKLDSTSGVNSARASNNVDSAIYVSENGDGFNTNGVSNTEAKKGTEQTIAVTTAVGGVTAVTSGSLMIGAASMGKASGLALSKFLYTKGWGLATSGSNYLNAASGDKLVTSVGRLASWGQGLGVVAGAALGAAGGLWLANNDIENSKEAFTTKDGEFNNDKANACKWTAGIAGAGVGGFAAAALLGVTPVGWGIGIAAVIGVAGFGIYQAIKKWWN